MALKTNGGSYTFIPPRARRIVGASYALFSEYTQRINVLTLLCMSFLMSST